jgi:hypothetical protein
MELVAALERKLGLEHQGTVVLIGLPVKEGQFGYQGTPPGVFGKCPVNLERSSSVSVDSHFLSPETVMNLSLEEGDRIGVGIISGNVRRLEDSNLEIPCLP